MKLLEIIHYVKRNKQRQLSRAKVQAHKWLAQGYGPITVAGMEQLNGHGEFHITGDDLYDDTPLRKAMLRQVIEQALTHPRRNSFTTYRAFIAVGNDVNGGWPVEWPEHLHIDHDRYMLTVDEQRIVVERLKQAEQSAQDARSRRGGGGGR